MYRHAKNATPPNIPLLEEIVSTADQSKESEGALSQNKTKLGRHEDTTSGTTSLSRLRRAECSTTEGTPSRRRTCQTSTAAAAARRAAAMAPARGKERFNRCAPERSRALNYSCNVNGFKSITSQSSSMFSSYLLFCFFVLLSSNCVSHTYAQSTSLSARDNVECTYANSTCSSCNVLCLHGEFYPLFPSSCHPSYEVSTELS